MKDLETVWKNDQKMTIREVADGLSSSRDFVCRLIRAGELSVMALGRRRRFVMRSDYEELLKRKYSGK